MAAARTRSFNCEATRFLSKLGHDLLVNKTFFVPQKMLNRLLEKGLSSPSTITTTASFSGGGRVFAQRIFSAGGFRVFRVEFHFCFRSKL